MGHFFVFLRSGREIEIPHDQELLIQEGENKSEDIINLMTPHLIISNHMMQVSVVDMQISNHNVLNIPENTQMHEVVFFYFKAFPHKYCISIYPEFRVLMQGKSQLY